MAEKRAAERKGDRPAARRSPSRPASVPQWDLQTLRFTRKNWILLGSGLLAIAAGFGLLATGDITVAPILLVTGYIVLIPWALVARTKGKDEMAAPEQRREA